MKNDISTLTMTVIISVIMIAMTANIIMDYASGEDKQMTNFGLNVDSLGESDTYTISVDAGGTVEINGVETDAENIFWLSESIFVYYNTTDNLTIRYYVSGTFAVSSYALGTDTFELSASAGTVSVTANSVAVSVTPSYEWAYVYDADGEYVYGSAVNDPPYIVNTDTITMFSIGERYLYHEGDLYFLGTLTTDEATYDWNLTDTDVEGIKILGSSPVTLNGDSRTMTQYVVSETVSYHIEGPLETEKNLFLVIPVLMIMAVLILCARSMFNNRD